MADEVYSGAFQLSACRELLDAYPESLRIQEQVEALEEAMPDRPGLVVSFCRTIMVIIQILTNILTTITVPSKCWVLLCLPVKHCTELTFRHTGWPWWSSIRSRRQHQRKMSK